MSSRYTSGLKTSANLQGWRAVLSAKTFISGRETITKSRLHIHSLTETTIARLTYQEMWSGNHNTTQNQITERKTSRARWHVRSFRRPNINWRTTWCSLMYGMKLCSHTRTNIVKTDASGNLHMYSVQLQLCVCMLCQINVIQWRTIAIGIKFWTLSVSRSLKCFTIESKLLIFLHY